MIFNHNVINKILKEIFPLPKHFGIIEGVDPTTEIINITNKIRQIEPTISLYHGASKMVIASPIIGNTVIKIPFNGFYEEDCETGELYWNDFCWATGSDSSDYCLAEYEKYHRLKTYGLDCFVAKTLYYKTIDGIRIFLQEQITPENDLCSFYTPSQQSKNIANKWYTEGKFNIESEWIANCLDKYGQSKVKRFLHYCKNIDLDILEDAHGGNYGYRTNGTPAILDYSNYMD